MRRSESQIECVETPPKCRRPQILLDQPELCGRQLSWGFLHSKWGGRPSLPLSPAAVGWVAWNSWRTCMPAIRIGLENVFQAHGVDHDGKVIIRKRLRRNDALLFFASLPPCLIGVEACSASHHRARELIKLGHEVRMMPARDVKPYVRRGKAIALMRKPFVKPSAARRCALQRSK